MHTTTAEIPASIQILPASLRDLLQLYRLEKRCFPLDSWPLVDILAALLLPRMVRLKAVDGVRMVGFVLGDRDRETGWIATIGVDPDYRQRGIGSALLVNVQEALQTRRFKLCVRASNGDAIRLYQRYGYRVVDTWSRYYRGGEDALVMERID